jgi:hypothetical protein
MFRQVNRLNTPTRGEEPNPVAFFETVHQAFQKAEQTVGSSIDRYYSVDSHTIRLRFAGPALVPRTTPALEHRATKLTPTPELTICLWDSASTQTEWPSLPWFEYGIHVTSNGKKVRNLYTPRGDIRGYNDGRIYTHIGADLFSLLDTKLNLAIYWCQDAAQLPIYESGAPVRTILHWWLRQHGRQLIHAGAVGTPAGGVLLAGKGGSGKSTAALSCLNSELVYVSDDYSLLGMDPIPYVYNLYNTAKVRANNIHRVPHLQHAISNADRLDTEKAIFYLYQHYPEKIVSGFPIRAILLPRVTGLPETTLTPAPAIKALSALALSTLHQLAGAGQETLQIVDQLVKQIPSYYLELGTDWVQIPDVILSLLSKE